MKEYKEYNAQNVLNEVNKLLDKYVFPIPIRGVCDQLSIFDWWVDNLSKTHLKQMKMFLENAIRLGFTGYACFKVGASGCSNGMWSCKEESVDGYSPEGDWIYRSFTPDYIYWSTHIGEKDFDYNCFKTVKQLEKLLEERK